MADFRIEFWDFRLMHDRDAYAVTVRLYRDGATLGLWQTWLSGPDLAAHGQHQGLNGLFVRAAAMHLTQVLENEVKQDGAPQEWSLDVHVVMAAADVAKIAARARGPLDPSVPTQGEVLAEFTA